jgi:hypothetical protein
MKVSRVLVGFDESAAPAGVLASPHPRIPASPHRRFPIVGREATMSELTELAAWLESRLPAVLAEHHVPGVLNKGTGALYLHTGRADRRVRA